MATVVEGLTKRAPPDHVAKVITGDAGAVIGHTINRDATERYVVILKDQDPGADGAGGGDITADALRVFNAETGASVDIKGPDGNSAASAANLAYLNCGDPAQDLKVLTINDYTFIVNRQKEAAMTADTTTDPGNQALVTIVQGNYSTEYTVKVTYGSISREVTITTPGSSDSGAADEIQTTAIAANMKTALATGSAPSPDAAVTDTGTFVAGEFDFAVSGATIHIQRDAPTTEDFDITLEDSVGNGNATVVKDTAQLFTDLPLVAPHDFITKIAGDPETGIDDYYVKFVADSGAGFEIGTWEETVAPGIAYKCNEDLMPHLLIRQSDGNFQFAPADGGTYTSDATTFTRPKWGGREAGDTTPTPDPGFIGEPINAIFFFMNGLGFLAGEKVILSEAGEFFNFFRTTITSLLDSAVIDVTAAHTKVSILRHAIPYVEVLVLFSDQTQFVLRSEGLLTPKTVSITPSTEFESDRYVAPEANGDSIFFATTRGSYAGIREYRDVSSQRLSFEATEVSATVPTYISGSISKMASSTKEDVLVIQASGSTSTLWIYKFFNNGGQRVQSSWFKFTFGSDADIKNVDFIDSTLYLLVQRTEGLFIESMDFAPGQADTDSTFKIALDRRIKESDCSPSPSYDSATDKTTFTLPYNISSGATMQVVSRATSTVEPGINYPITSSTTNTVVVSGDLSAAPVWIGEQYTKKYTFTKIHLQQPSQRGGMAAVLSGRYQLRNGTLLFEDSGYFKVKVTPRYQSAYEYPFTGRVLGSGNNLIGSPSIEDGVFKFPLMGKHDELTVEVENDSPLPSRLLGAEWEASYNPRSTRMG